MAESKKRLRKRKEEIDFVHDENLHREPTAEQYRLAVWMHQNVPIKRTKFAATSVEYFTGSIAVDCIWQSYWSIRPRAHQNDRGDDQQLQQQQQPQSQQSQKPNDSKSKWLLSFSWRRESKSQQPALFHSRDEIAAYLNSMLLCKMFHRAKKVAINVPTTKGSAVTNTTNDDTATVAEQDADAVSVAAAAAAAAANQKKKRKVRLEMHFDQHFEDNLDAYVWLYKPTPWHYWIVGTLLVFGGIVLCMFPLWPPVLRQSVYYLSLAVIGFLVFIILLALLRHVLFVFVWIFTLGRHHFWLLPNLTEDVGFIESFIPLYKYEYKGPKKSDKKAKQSDDEDDTKDTAANGQKKNKKAKTKKNTTRNPALAETIETVKEESAATVTAATDSAVCEKNSAKQSNADDVPKKMAAAAPEIDEPKRNSRSSSSDRDFEIVNVVDLETN